MLLFDKNVQLACILPLVAHVCLSRTRIAQGDECIVAVWNETFVRTHLLPIDIGRYIIVRGFGVMALRSRAAPPPKATICSALDNTPCSTERS